MRQPGQSEVGDPEVVAVIDQEIRWLDVTMNDANLMGMFEGKSRLKAKLRDHLAMPPVVQRRSGSPDCGGMDGLTISIRCGIPGFGLVDRTCRRCRAKASNDISHRTAFNVLHGVVMDPLVAPYAKNGHDVLVVQQGRGLGLDLKALALAPIERRGRWQYLERDATAEWEVIRLVYNTHPAASDLADDPVFAQHRRQKRVADGRPGGPGLGKWAHGILHELETLETIAQNISDRWVAGEKLRSTWPLSASKQLLVLFECRHHPAILSG